MAATNVFTSTNLRYFLYLISIIYICCLNFSCGLDLNVKQSYVTKLERCASELESLHEGANTDNEHDVYNMENLKQTLANLENSTEEEMRFYNDAIDRLISASNISMKIHTLNDLKRNLLQNSTDDSSDSVACVVPGNDSRVDGGYWVTPQVPSRPRYLRRKRTGELGATWINELRVCPHDYYCDIRDVVFLSDGVVAFSDYLNFEIKVFNIEGHFIKKISTVPLKPTKMAHLKDFTVLVRVRLLTGSHAVLEFNLWTERSKVLIELGRFPWEYACHGDVSVVQDTVFIACEPYVFMYHVNGTFIRKIQANDQNRKISTFKSEEGVNVTAIYGPGFPEMFEGTQQPFLVNENFEALCILGGNYGGAVGKDGIYTFSGTTIWKFDYNCSSVGILATKRRRRQKEYSTIAVFNNILVGIVNLYRRKQSNFLVMVCKIR